MNENTIFNFADCSVKPQLGVYGNGNIAMQLVDAETGEPIAVATVNPGFELPRGFIGVKDWSENEGMVEALLAAGIIDEVTTKVPSGYVSIPICRLTKGALEFIDNFLDAQG